jgi:two-component system NtrC family sensor kinase
MQSEPRLRYPLGLKLALALLGIAVLLLVFLFGYFGPFATKSFITRSSTLIDRSREELRDMVVETTEESKDVLVKLIRQTADSRRRQLMDLPLSLYDGDVERMREVLEETDARRSDRRRENVELLAGEMERRSLDELDQRLVLLSRNLVILGDAFAADIRMAYLLLVGAVFAALFLLLGFGLFRTVVHPLRELRRGTRAVAQGNLAVEVPVRSADEVGGLAADFASMVRQLRESHESIRKKNVELENLTHNLEDEVRRKTQNLERTQRQLIHAEKMASIGTLAGGVAHEFNNLIGGIRGCVAEALATEDDAGRREPLEVISRAAVRASEITDQLLRFARQRAMRMQNVEVTRTVEEALLLVEPDARQRGVTIVRKIEPGIAFSADGDALHQVFLNLYSNALQAMPDGGALTVEARKVNSELEVQVSDTGVGIPPDQVDRIFEPFFTTKDQEADPTARGSGLGLSVSYSIVEAHGGIIEVDSEPGRGTSFTVKLPIAEPKDE